MKYYDDDEWMHVVMCSVQGSAVARACFYTQRDAEAYIEDQKPIFDTICDCPDVWVEYVPVLVPVGGSENDKK